MLLKLFYNSRKWDLSYIILNGFDAIEHGYCHSILCKIECRIRAVEFRVFKLIELNISMEW